MRSSSHKTWQQASIGVALLGFVFVSVLYLQTPVRAAAGINQQLNFQGRLLNTAGATVSDGVYNVEFKIYQDGDGQSVGDTTGSPSGSLKWTEDHLVSTSSGVIVKNGYLSVQLGSVSAFGSSINWNQDTLWLSVNVGNTSSCTISTSFNTDCGGDGEMVPMKRLSSNPYALNAGQLGGMTSAQFVQLAQGLQTDASTSTNSIYINKTGSGGNFLDLQAGGSDAFVLSNIGDISFGANANHTLGVATAAASTAGKGLTVSAGTAGTGGAALAGGNLTLQGGNGGGTNGNGGNLTLDAGAANGSGTNGSINIGTTTASSITIGATSQTGPITIQQSGISETMTGSGTAPTVIIKTSTNSSGAFQVQNSSSNRVLGVDTSASQVLLGQSNTVNGSLVFKNSASSNAITLNSTAANVNYTLTLPSAAPATGLCIETSTGNANQLVFASCSNNNTSISEVQEWDANNTNVVTVSPFAVGDVIVLTTQIPTGSVTVSSVAGGGVTTWTKAVVNTGNGTVNRVEMWIGTVASLGSSNITVTYSSSPGAEEVTATDFTAAGVNASTSWGIESTASQLNSTSSSTVTFPNLIPINGAELYVGYAQVQNPPATSGSTTGFNYIVTSTQHNVITYDPSTTANTAYQPTANQNSAGQSNTIGAILTAFVTSTSINNATSIQKANFYVQSATGGSVAGVLQAASSGSADILNLRNSSAVNVASVGNTGATVFKNSTDSSAAFQVQNSSGNSLLTVNTSGSTVALGTASVLGGSLTFNDAGDSNTITLKAPTSIATSYQLALPTNTPTAGLCLGTSPSSATQLIFASCATQVSAASITYINKWDNHGTSVTTITDSPASIGNLVVFYSHTANTVNVNSISGGGVGSWTKVTAYSAGGTPGNIEMWRGVVTTTGSGTITVTYSGTAGTNEIVAEEYSMGSANGTWAIDTSGTSTTTSSVTTVNYPSLTPLNSSELYAGYAYGGGTMSTGSTAGFTYVATGASKYLAYDTSVTGGTTYAPTTPQTSGVYASVAAVIAAYSGTSVIVDSTATQEANFNVQAATSGTVAGVLQAASSGAADIFQAKDSSGNNIVAVNASSGLTLGTPSAVAGTLNFAATGNSNTISVTAPTTPGASYSLTLPSTTPAAGQCLATSPSNANQLVFSSCANQVTSVAISLVNNWKVSTSGLAPTLSVSPVNIGDLITFFVHASKGNTVTSISGGGVTTWTQIVGANSEVMYKGIVTATGSSTITIGLSTPSGPTDELAAQEWTTGSTNGSWVIDASGTINNASSTTVTYPSLTPQSTKDLYIGYAIGTSTMSAGSTSGYSYLAGGGSSDYGAYNTTVSATSQPTATQSSAGTSIAAAALIAAYSSSSVISNSTVTQEANFNIQAATGGTVAGVLQAASSGTADVMQIMNATGTVVDSFSSTGNLLIEPSTASASALRVQTTLGVNVLSVDNSNLRVVVGAGATGESTPSLLVLDSQTGSSSDPTEVNGGMYYNATTHSFRCGVDGSWQTCSGLLYSNTSSSTAVNNCTTNCSAFSINAPVPANYCQAGRVLNVVASGYFSSTATPNLQFGVYYGTSSTSAASDTLIGTLSPAAPVPSASNNAFQISDNLICFSTSSVMAEGTARVQTGSAASGMAVLPISATSGTTVSTSSPNNLYIFPIWDTASTSNTAVLTQLTVNAY